jgi:hypothetical protein
MSRATWSCLSGAAMRADQGRRDGVGSKPDGERAAYAAVSLARTVAPVSAETVAVMRQSSFSNDERQSVEQTAFPFQPASGKTEASG